MIKSHNAKSELDEYDTVQEFEPKKSDGAEKSEQKSVEGIAERVKLRRQKSDELNELIINKKLFKQYFQYQNLSDLQKKIV